MFYRGGMSQVGFFNRDGWFGRGPVLGKADTECNGDTCVLVAQRLDQNQSKALYDQMKYAVASKPDCMSNVSDAAAAKIEKAVLGIEPNAPLTKSEADGIMKFGECTGPIPPGTPIGYMSPVPSSVGGSSISQPLLIGVGALAVLGLILAVAR
jgi:hypothetical protein